MKQENGREAGVRKRKNREARKKWEGKRMEKKGEEKNKMKKTNKRKRRRGREGEKVKFFCTAIVDSDKWIKNCFLNCFDFQTQSDQERERERKDEKRNKTGKEEKIFLKR